MANEERLAAQVVTGDTKAAFVEQRLGLSTAETPASDVPAPVVDATVEAAPAEPTAEADAEVVTPLDVVAEVKDKEPKTNPKLERRFSEMTRQREQARDEARQEREKREQVEAKVRELESRLTPTVVSDDEEPRPSAYHDAYEYAKDLSVYAASKALRDRDQQQAMAQAQEQRTVLMQSWATRIEETKAELPNFVEMVESSDIRISDPVRDAILESEVGPKILYHLAEHPEVAEKLTRGSMITALREIGRLEAQFIQTHERPEPVKPSLKSKAPAPITPLRSNAGGAVAHVDADGEYHGSFQAWKQARLAGKIR